LISVTTGTRLGITALDVNISQKFLLETRLKSKPFDALDDLLVLSGSKVMT